MGLMVVGAAIALIGVVIGAAIAMANKKDAS